MQFTKQQAAKFVEGFNRYASLYNAGHSGQPPKKGTPMFLGFEAARLEVYASLVEGLSKSHVRLITAKMVGEKVRMTEIRIQRCRL